MSTMWFSQESGPTELFERVRFVMEAKTIRANADLSKTNVAYFMANEEAQLTKPNLKEWMVEAAEVVISSGKFITSQWRKRIGLRSWRIVISRDDVVRATLITKANIRQDTQRCSPAFHRFVATVNRDLMEKDRANAGMPTKSQQSPNSATDNGDTPGNAAQNSKISKAGSLVDTALSESIHLTQTEASRVKYAMISHKLPPISAVGYALGFFPLSEAPRSGTPLKTVRKMLRIESERRRREIQQLLVKKRPISQVEHRVRKASPSSFPRALPKPVQPAWREVFCYVGGSSDSPVQNDKAASLPNEV
jgi:hypothetical protein